MNITVKVSGYEQIERNLKSIQRAMSNALEDIVRVGAYPIENEAKALAPVKTGTLRRSIHTEIAEKTVTRVVARIGPSVPYGARLEFGFVGRDSLGRHYDQAPRPYMRPAFEAKKQEAYEEMRAIARQTISDALVEEVAQRGYQRYK